MSISTLIDQAKIQEPISAPQLQQPVLSAPASLAVDSHAAPQVSPATPQPTEPSAQEKLDDLVQVFKLLSSGPRLQILAHLVQEGELNVTDLCERVHQTQPAVSHHLALLKLHRLISLRREGKHSYYSIRPEQLNDVVANLANIVLGKHSRQLQLNDILLTRITSS